MLNQGTIILLGLERDIWEITPASEKAHYKRVATCFYLLNVLTIVSGSYLMHLLGFNWLLAIMLGAVSAFILMSIVRFSLIIHRRSVFEYEKEREVLDAKLASRSKEETAAENEKASTKSHAEKVGQIILAPIRAISEYFNNGKAYGKIPGLGGLIRSGILLMVVFLIIFPLAALIHKSFVEEINERRRKEYVGNYNQDENIRLTNSVADMKKEIEEIRLKMESGRENNSANTLAENQERIQHLNNKIEELNLKSAADRQLFSDKLKDRYFLVFTLSAIRTKPGFNLSLIVVLLLIILPHWILHRLKMDPNSFYAENAILKYRDIIDKEYEKTETAGYEFLEKEFNYQPGPFRRNIFWNNPPYCTVPRIHFSKKTSIGKSDFLKMRENR